MRRHGLGQTGTASKQQKEREKERKSKKERTKGRKREKGREAARRTNDKNKMCPARARKGVIE